jgi:SAM-dependent methyltransferase
MARLAALLCAVLLFHATGASLAFVFPARSSLSTTRPPADGQWPGLRYSIPDLDASDTATAAAAAAAAGQAASGFELTSPAVGVGAAALGAFALGAFRLAVYLRMQYITAALLSRRLPEEKPSGGLDVLELSAKDARNLYYLRPGAAKRVILSATADSKLTEGFAESAATQAGIPVVNVREQEQGKLDCPDNIIDVVVSVGGFMASNNAKTAVKEVARVLKSNGGTLLMVEPGTCELLIDELKRKVGDDIEVNLVQNIWRPYTVAVVKKNVPIESSVEAAGSNSKKKGASSRRKGSLTQRRSS